MCPPSPILNQLTIPHAVEMTLHPPPVSVTTQYPLIRATLQARVFPQIRIKWSDRKPTLICIIYTTIA